MLRTRLIVAMILVTIDAASANTQTITRGESYTVTRATGPIAVDGRLDDVGWYDAVRIERWYEIDPGDNVEPPVRSTGYLTYDDHFLYLGFEFEDPDPKRIVAPYGDHDALATNADFGGVFIDTRNEGHTAYEFQVSPHNIQYDAIMDDNGGGQNAAPDFFWDSATRIHDHGWTLEMRIPFSTLRYGNRDPQTWGIMLYRNYVRGVRRQITSVRLPRGGQCLVCYEGSLTGLHGLPSGGHFIAAPDITVAQAAYPSGDLGAPLMTNPLARKFGLDAKYAPNADNAIDATLHPDFSQIESDTAQISTNARFALFYPEKRPFFMEGIELFSTPIQAVYTRTITAPEWGTRATGKVAGIGYTALVARDTGGGSVVIPGASASSLAPDDFRSTVFLGRVKRDVGLSFVSAIVADRESGLDGHNRVVGPDFQVRLHGTDTINGQLLVSDTRTPTHPDLDPTWTGRGFTSAAAQLSWNHNTEHYDAQVLYKDLGSDFRADSGFVPQVGYRETSGSTGWTFHPAGFFNRVRAFANLDSQQNRENGTLLDRSMTTGANANTRWNGLLQIQYLRDQIRVGSETFLRQQVVFYQRVSPSRRFAQLGVDGNAGQDVDFTNTRQGRGGSVNANATVSATDHLAVDLIANMTWLRVDDTLGADRSLFTSRVERIRVNYTFTAKSFVRLVGQYVSTDRDPTLYLQHTSAHDGLFNGSVLLAYKINWQSVMFFGYGDDRTLDQQRRLQRMDRQVFVKLSYAFQR